MNLSVRNVTKRFPAKATPAVFDACFTATSGGITTLLGPSGSGKTTLLRVVAGLETADEGQVLFDDRDVTRVPARARGIGLVFQAFALFNHMTVSRNIAYGLEVRGASEKEKRERVLELLELVQLDRYGDRFPRQLSGGERQRVGFARALACRPEILLLDEPFAALDARVRVELREWLTRLHESTRLTTILVTHDQDEALELSAQIVVMDQGRVVQVGTPGEIYDDPKTPFVASFVGTANVLRGRVEGEKVTIGPLSVSAPRGAKEGARVQAIVRPHNVRVAKNDAEHPERSVGTVTRVVGLGSFVKLQLEIPSHDPMTVQLTRTEAESMGLATGDKVIVDLAEARIFFEDYSI
jgi:sulfate transport system ATP-binding protein